MQLLTTVKETFVGESDEGGGGTVTEREQPSSAVEVESEADHMLATGRTREQTLLELVDAHEGRVKQAELVELTGWSKSTVSRKLSELERDGAIKRIQIGRCKVVLLPEKSLVGEHTVTYDTYR